MNGGKTIDGVTNWHQWTVGIIMPLGSQQGGAEALLGHLLEAAPASLRLVLLFFEDGPMVGLAKGLGHNTSVLSVTRLSSMVNYLRSVSSIRRWVREHKIDLVLSWMSKAHLYVSLASIGVPVKVVWYQHGVPDGAMIDRIATLFPTDAILCCSKVSQRYQDLMRPGRLTFVCYPGVSNPRVDGTSKQVAREELGLQSQSAVVCMVSRLERWKGVQVFIAAANSIWEASPDALLVVVGGAHPADAVFAEELRALVERTSRPSQFVLVGQKSMGLVRKWQRAADLVVHPVTGVEAFGMAVPEAMALGRVVVASNEGGPSEVIEDGVSGVLIPKGDAAKLSDAVVKLLQDPERRITIEAEAMLRAAQFGITTFVERIETLLIQLLQS